jgi:Yip1 domain
MTPSSASSPFIAIWTEPRMTIRNIVERDPHRYVLGLAALGPALVAVESAWARMLSAQTPAPFLWPIEVAFIALFAGAIGIAALYFNGWALRWTGAIVGGVATSVEVRAALAWSRIPAIAAAALSVAATLLGAATPPAFMNGHLPRFTPSSVGLGLVNLVLGVWSLVVMLQCVGEVHRFSAWRALGAILIEAGAFLLLVILLIVFAEIIGARA